MGIAEKVTAVVPCWNRQKDLDKLLESFLRLKEQPRIIVVDDLSDKPLQASNADIVRVKQKVGKSTAKNIGLALCQTPFVWFLDSDTEIAEPDVLERALAHFAASSQIGAVGAEIYDKGSGMQLFCEHKVLPDCSSFRYLYPLKKRICKEGPLITTCNLVARTDAVKAIGGFCDHLTYHEDKVLCFDLRERGYHLVLDSELKVFHHLSPESRVPEQKYFEDWTSDSAFVFGAFSHSPKRRWFRAHTLAARVIEFLGTPKLLLDYHRLKHSAFPDGADTMIQMILRLASRYKKQTLGFFKPAATEKLQQGAEYRQERQQPFEATNYLPYIEKVERQKLQTGGKEKPSDYYKLSSR